MDWESVWKVAVAIIGSIGGAGAIICAIVKFSSDRIAERLSAKYQLKLDKELEKFKSVMSKKNYVSKARFDTEFALCKELMVSCKEMIHRNYLLFPSLDTDSIDIEKSKTVLAEKLASAVESHNTFTALLTGNAPFISKHVYECFSDLEQQCLKNVSKYHYRLPIRSEQRNDDFERINALIEAYDQASKYTKALDDIADELRLYFESMDIQE